MVIFFANTRASVSYFNKLATFISGSALVYRPRALAVPAWRALLDMPRSLLIEYLSRSTKEYQAHYQRLPGVLWTIRQWIAAHWHYACDRRLLDRVTPTMVVVWNGLQPRRSIFVTVAQHNRVPCVYMENGLLPQTTVCDGQGVNANNSMPRDPDFYRRLPLAPEPEQTNLTVREVRATRQISGKSLPGRYIFVPFQVDYDTQIVLFSPWVKDMQDLFRELLEQSHAMGSTQLVFKEHPSSKRDYRHLHDLLPPGRGIFANEYATQTLIKGAEAVVTINSTVGIEALLFGKKVVVLGDAFYAIPGLMLSARDSKELTSALARLDQFTPDEILRRNFLAYLKNRYLISGSARTADMEHCRLVKERFDAILQENKG